MQTDTIKALGTYVAALILIVGGLVVLVITPVSDTRLIVAGFMGSAITFLFTRETQTQTGHQVAAASLAALNGHTNPEPAP